MPASLFVATFLMFSQQSAVTEPVLRANYLVEMDQQFHNMDGDGDGLVTPQEVAARQNADGRAQVLAANQQIFLQLDQDGNGMLTAEEFARLAPIRRPSCSGLISTRTVLSRWWNTAR